MTVVAARSTLWSLLQLGRIDGVSAPAPLWGRAGLGGRADPGDYLICATHVSSDDATPHLVPPPQGGGNAPTILRANSKAKGSRLPRRLDVVAQHRIDL